MMCKKCGGEFSPTKGLKSYCSLECRNSRVRTDDTKRKIGIGVSMWQKRCREERPDEWKAYTKKLSDTSKRTSELKRLSWKKKMSLRSFDSLAWDARRSRVLDEQSGKCAHCGIDEWKGHPLTLEVDHINGDHSDNRRENLVGLCPNCHSITDTWRGRNKQTVTTKITDAVALVAIKSTSSIRQALIKCGLSPRGGNYVRFQRLKNLGS